MKRTILLLALIGLSALTIASCGTAKKADDVNKTKKESVISEKILGCKFGQSKSLVRRKMDKERLIQEKERALTYRDVSFAGTEWDYVIFAFNVNKKLQSVNFQRHYKDGTCAMNDYRETSVLLSLKYLLKMPSIQFDTLAKSESVKEGCVWSSENRRVTAKVEFTQSVGGEYFWYNNLIYNDEKYALENIKRALKEL